MFIEALLSASARVRIPDESHKVLSSKYTLDKSIPLSTGITTLKRLLWEGFLVVCRAEERKDTDIC